MNLDLKLMEAALRGEEDAVKIYCGSYTLVRCWADGKLYRLKEDKVPDGCMECIVEHGEYVYDDDGFLLPKYWSLPRIEKK